MISAFAIISLLLLAGCSGGGGEKAGTDSKNGKDEITKITYWQYTFPAKVEEIAELIKKFEAENPDIKVEAQDFPYDQYNDKITAAMHANKAPDIINIYYGWIPNFVKLGYIQPIPEDFMSTQEIEDYYVPMIQSSKIDDKYYTLPIAVRSLALFWNKELFEEAGLDPEQPPKTWDEFMDYAIKTTKRDSDDRYEQAGFAWNISAQGQHVIPQVLLRQWGVDPYSEDQRTVQWNSKPEGAEAFKFWMDMTTEHKIGAADFMDTPVTSFSSGRTAMNIDGSFNISAYKENNDFEWGVTTLPVREIGGLESNFGSYWTNAITKDVSGKQLEASQRFLEFLISEETQKSWLENVGELPAAAALADDKEITDDPIYGPFVKGLEKAHATPFVNEEKEREAVINAVDRIILEKEDVEKSLNTLVEQLQEIRDEFYNK
nr:extracellular solute-binding protein [Bacillus sp. FJAT-50079]